MEQITLTGSFIQQFAQEPFTFFIAHQNERYGIVAAGSWDTVLPFCFEEIRVGRSGRIIARHSGKQHIYRIISENHSLRAVCDDPFTWDAGHFAICLPA